MGGISQVSIRPTAMPNPGISHSRCPQSHASGPAGSRRMLLMYPIAGRPPRWRAPAASTSSGSQSCRRRLCWMASLWSS